MELAYSNWKNGPLITAPSPFLIPRVRSSFMREDVEVLLYVVKDTEGGAMKLRWPLAASLFVLCMSFDSPLPSLADSMDKAAIETEKQKMEMEREAQKKRHEMELEAQKDKHAKERQARKQKEELMGEAEKLQREQRKHKEAMAREEEKHQTEMAREERKHREEMGQGGQSN
jgi:hypothetical protein